MADTTFISKITPITTDWAQTVNNLVYRPTTAPQFDNSLLYATTAFIQRALGNRSGISILSTTTFLTATDAGKMIQFTGGVSRAITLPPSSGLSPGVSIAFWSNATAVFTIHPQGTDTISTGVTLPASVNVNTGDTVEFVYRGSGVWIMCGALQLGSSATMFGGTFAANGYQKLPSGLYIQWGSFAGSASADTAVTFPIQFPTAVYGLVTSAQASGAGAWAGWNSATVTGFNGNMWAASGTRQSGSAFYIAVGK